jgi:hypothetical protein
MPPLVSRQLSQFPGRPIHLNAGVGAIFFAKPVFPSACARGPWLVALALAAMAPAVRGQTNLSGVVSYRKDTNYYMGLLYDLGGAPTQILSTDANGIRTVELTDGSVWSYQVTPITINPFNGPGAVYVPDQMFLPLTQAGTGVLAPSGSGSPFFGFSYITIDPLGPFYGDKAADQSTISGFISANNGGTHGTFVSSGNFETRDLYYGIFSYYWSLSASEMLGEQYTDPAGHIYAKDTNLLIVRDQSYLMDQAWPVTMNVVGSSMTYLYTIPEPSTYAALLGLGALGFAAYRRRRRQAA